MLSAQFVGAISSFGDNHRMPVENPNLFVVTGGPGCGKTTLLLELQKLGFRFAPEVARQIIQQQVQIGGEALPWKNRQLYTEMMLERSIASYNEHTPARNVMFSDRGIPDTLAYARLIGLANQDSIRDVCAEYRYATRVFLAPPWEEIYETDSERKQEFEEATRTYSKILEVYEECGYELVVIPRIAPPARAQFVLGYLPV